MAFIKEVNVYQRGKVRVYINQCYNKGRKTYLYAVRRDDGTGMGALLGLIRFDGRWRQYTFQPETDWQTIWSASCLSGISKFLEKINKKWRKKVNG